MQMYWIARTLANFFEFTFEFADATFSLPKLIRSFIVRPLSFLILALTPHGAKEVKSYRKAPQIEISAEEFEKALRENITKVEEFAFIKAEAEKLGVDIYLFGGTAAGYGHYVRWDLMRQKGDKRFQPDRFTYRYEHIYRSTQDADLIVDGPADAADQLTYVLQHKFPHLQGEKPVWELRLLRETYKGKESVLEKDFQNQHTDSNSTGLIKITDPKSDQSIVKDALAWNSDSPPFFNDIREGKISFYYSFKHNYTKRAASGLNPSIFAAIRYLTKKYQYQLQTRSKDEPKIRSIFKNTSNLTHSNEYVHKWLEKNGPKILQHAVDIEYAVEDADKYNLRNILRYKNNETLEYSLAWWMQKAPLTSKTLGLGLGKTAKELGINIVAHDAKDFLAYESITRSHMGFANAFISRRDKPGERAFHGDGFYVRQGTSGAVGNGITIRFKMHPKAREGSDFLHIASFDGDAYIVVLNKEALELIPEAINITPVNLLQLYMTGDISSFDTGQRFKLKRSIQSMNLNEVPELEIDEVLKTFQDPKKIEFLIDALSLFTNVIIPKLKANEKEWINKLTDLIKQSHSENRALATAITADALVSYDPSSFDRYPELTKILISNGDLVTLSILLDSNLLLLKSPSFYTSIAEKLAQQLANYFPLHNLSDMEQQRFFSRNLATRNGFTSASLNSVNNLITVSVERIFSIIGTLGFEQSEKIIESFFDLKDFAFDNSLSKTDLERWAIKYLLTSIHKETFKPLMIKRIRENWTNSQLNGLLEGESQEFAQILADKEIREAVYSRCTSEQFSRMRRIFSKDKDGILDEAIADFLSLDFVQHEMDFHVLSENIATSPHLARYKLTSAKLFEYFAKNSKGLNHFLQSLKSNRAVLAYLPTLKDFIGENRQSPSYLFMKDLLFNADHFQDPIFDDWRKTVLIDDINERTEKTQKLAVPDCSQALRDLAPEYGIVAANR